MSLVTPGLLGSSRGYDRASQAQGIGRGIIAEGRAVARPLAFLDRTQPYEQHDSTWTVKDLQSTRPAPVQVAPLSKPLRRSLVSEGSPDFLISNGRGGPDNEIPLPRDLFLRRREKTPGSALTVLRQSPGPARWATLAARRALEGRRVVGRKNWKGRPGDAASLPRPGWWGTISSRRLTAGLNMRSSLHAHVLRSAEAGRARITYEARATRGHSRAQRRPTNSVGRISAATSRSRSSAWPYSGVRRAD